VLENKLTIHHIEELYEELVPSLNFGEDVKFNLENISEIDTSGIQFLLSLQKTYINNQKEFALSNVKEEILYAFELTGVDSILGV
jgi:anti-anti-sigma factor